MVSRSPMYILNLRGGADLTSFSVQYSAYINAHMKTILCRSNRNHTLCAPLLTQGKFYNTIYVDFYIQYNVNVLKCQQYFVIRNIDFSKHLIYTKEGEGVMTKNPFISGITDLLILSILKHHDSYMYEMIKMITEYSGGLLVISQNTIYTAAYKLQSEGKISEYTKLVGKKRTRVYYRLEPKGEACLAELSENYKKTSDGVKNIFSVLEQEEKSGEQNL